MLADQLICRRDVALVWIGAFVMALAFCWPVFREIENFGLGDWDQHFFYHAVARHAVVNFHQLPGWNPYYFGGTVCLANPQSRIFAPGFALVCGLGVPAGLKVDLLLHLVVAIAGACFLAFRLGMGWAGTIVTSAVAALNGAYFWNLAVGHTWFMSVCYGPWIWMYWMRARRGEPHAAVLAGAWLALTWLDGGAYVVIILGTLLALQLLAEWHWRNWRQEGMALILTGLVAVSLSAVKLFPSVQFMRMFPRPTDTHAGYSLFGLLHSLFHPQQSFASERRSGPPGDFWRGSNFGLDENGMYIGIVAGGLLLVGLISRPPRGLWMPLLVLMWLMWGDRTDWSLWEWVHHWVPFRWMRVAMRFRIAWLLPVAALCGFGAHWLQCRWANTRMRWAVWILVALLVADLVRENGRILSGAFPVAPFSRQQPGRFIQVASAPGYPVPAHIGPYTPRLCWSSHYPLFLSNIGAVTGYEVMPIPKRAIPVDDHERYRGEVYLADRAGSASFLRWTPNVWEIQAESSMPTRVVVNQNYYPGWQETTNHWPVQSHEGLISIEIPEGSHRLALAYEPPGFRAGAATTIAAGVFWAFVAIWWRIRAHPSAPGYALPQAIRMGAER